MRQYLEIKNRYADAILMFRMGDFYELFFEDAVTVGPVLDIAVTTRDKNAEDPVPMAGVPYHAIGGYLRTLVEQGFKVAICEQMETPEEAKRRKGPNIVHREVVRVATPGALLDEDHLRAGEPNYLVAVAGPGDPDRSGAGVAALDISCGEFVALHCEDGNTLAAELARLSPREIVTTEKLGAWLTERLGPECPRLELGQPSPKSAARQRVLHLLEESGGDATLPDVAVEAAARALEYAEATQPGQTLLLHRLRRHDPGGHLLLDETSLRNLEVFRTIRDGQRRGSLLWAVDATQTAMGARMLRAWLGAPLRDLEMIRRRQEGVAALMGEARLRQELASRLKDVRDIVRLAARARLKTINPRELGALRSSLAALPDLVTLLEDLRRRRTDHELPAVLDLGDDLLEDVHAELARVLIEQPPSVLRDGGVIADGADPRLDEQRELARGGKAALAAIEAREREVTQIPPLKIQHNRVFGYFIDIPKAHMSRVPDHYVRKQTLANSERYVTEELAGLESKVLGAQSEALTLELELFEGLRELVSRAGERLVTVGERVAQLDVLAGLAEVAEQNDFVRPELVEGPGLRIVEGRHAVVERMLGRGRFVPNDVVLKAQGGVDEPRLLVITGPNMGGKSTVMRQVALIVLLAHVGSFVPAREAEVGLVDRIFTRVGAADDLGRGDSTFMVEMRETAQILSQATSRSLVLLDEIGRGTATFDGLALAWAITEFLHDQIGCRTLFATHYHELCGLSDRLPGVQNAHVAVHEQRGRIVFLHRLEPGPAGRSYGIHVGRLAVLPARAVRRATRILERLEAQERITPGPQLDLFAPRAGEGDGEVARTPVGGDLPAGARDALSRLAETDPDELSPRQAHALLCDLHALLED